MDERLLSIIVPFTVAVLTASVLFGLCSSGKKKKKKTTSEYMKLDSGSRQRSTDLETEPKEAEDKDNNNNSTSKKRKSKRKKTQTLSAERVKTKSKSQGVERDPDIPAQETPGSVKDAKTPRKIYESMRKSNAAKSDKPDDAVNIQEMNPKEFGKIDPFFSRVGGWKWQRFYLDYSKAIGKAKDQPFPPKIDPEACEIYKMQYVVVSQYPRRNGIDPFLQGVLKYRPSHILMLNKEEPRELLYYPKEEGKKCNFVLENGQEVNLICKSLKRIKDTDIEYRELDIVSHPTGQPTKEKTFKLTHIKAHSLVNSIRVRHGSLLSELDNHRDSWKVLNELVSDDSGVIFVHCETGYTSSPMIALALMMMRAVLTGDINVDPLQFARELHDTIPGALHTPKEFLLGLDLGLFCLAFRINPEIAEFDHMNNAHNFEIDFLEANHKGDDYVHGELEKFETGGDGPKEKKKKKTLTISIEKDKKSFSPGESVPNKKASVVLSARTQNTFKTTEGSRKTIENEKTRTSREKLSKR